MKHGVKKIKLGQGIDDNRMLIRKLLINFFYRGRIVTTITKAKALKPIIEKIVEKSKERLETNKNYLLKTISQKHIISLLFNTVGPVIKNKKGGYVRIIRLGKRYSDNTEMAKIEWVYPIVLENEPKIKSKKQTEKGNPKNNLHKKP